MTSEKKKGGIEIADVRAAAATAPLAVYQSLGLSLKKTGDHWAAKCPFHKDKTPSFKVFADGKFKCFSASCDVHGDVLDFFCKKNGAKLADAIPEVAKLLGVGGGKTPRPSSAPPQPPPWEEEKSDVACFPFPPNVSMPPIDKDYRGYTYHNEAGEGILFKFSKTKSPVWYDGVALQFRGLPRRPLFGLPLLADANRKRDIIIAEGEKAAQSLADVDFLATTWIGGSSAWQKAEWKGLPTGRRIYIWPDNDDAGAKAAENIANMLVAKGREVFVIQTGGMEKYKDKGGDAADIPEPERVAETERRMQKANRWHLPPAKAAPSSGGGAPPWEGDTGEDGKKLPLQRRLRNALEVLGAQERIRTDVATWKVYIDGEELSDAALHKLARHLDSAYEVSVSLTALKDAIGGIAEQYTFNSFRDKLEATPWDGKHRLDEIATRYLGDVEDSEIANTYLAAWLTAGVARRLEHERPIKFDIMIILRGEEGIGKNSFLDALFGDLLISHDFISAQEKDTMTIIGDAMCVEMPELAGLARRDWNFVKAFISRGVDKFRAPYARLPTTRPRRQILCGSTNDPEYLNGLQGARRFADIHILSGEINFPLVGRDREQLFAEAYERWKELGDEAVAIPRQIWQQTRDKNRHLINQSPLQAEVDRWIESAKAAGRNYIAAAQISTLMEAEGGNGKPGIVKNNQNFAAIRIAFEKNDWQKKRVSIRGQSIPFRKELRWQPRSEPTVADPPKDDTF